MSEREHELFKTLLLAEYTIIKLNEMILLNLNHSKDSETQLDNILNRINILKKYQDKEMKKTITETMIDVMNKYREYQVDIGTPSLWGEVFEKCKMKPSKNCLNNGVRVMNALEKSDKFIKGYIQYNRVVRVFTLKEKYRLKQ